MFNIGGGEIMVIALIALIVVGPEQLPGLLRKAGQLAAQVRSLSNGFREEFMNGVQQADPTRWAGQGTDESPIVPRGYSSNGSVPAETTDTVPPADTGPPAVAVPPVDAAPPTDAPSTGPVAPTVGASDPEHQVAEVDPPTPGSLEGPPS